MKTAKDLKDIGIEEGSVFITTDKKTNSFPKKFKVIELTEFTIVVNNLDDVTPITRVNRNTIEDLFANMEVIEIFK